MSQILPINECLLDLRRGLLDRRTAAKLAVVFGATVSSPHLLADTAPPPCGLGLVMYVASLRRRWTKNGLREESDLFSPSVFLKHCKSLGAGGMQVSLGVMSTRNAEQLAEQAARNGQFIEAIIKPPTDADDLGRFESEIQTAKAAGALAVRTVILPGRRYERFRSRGEFESYVRRGEQMIRLATPIVEKYQLPLAIENHKDQRNEERIALLQRIDSEFVGVCLDTGNSVALLEDPLETVRTFAPWAKSVHLKDQAVRAYEDGFLLGDIALGRGCFDLPAMVQAIRDVNPEVRFSLELITRDPLKVPCLTDRYWSTMSQVAGRDLARTMRLVRDRASESMTMVSSLPEAKQVELEDQNVRASLDYARDVLRL